LFCIAAGTLGAASPLLLTAVTMACLFLFVYWFDGISPCHAEAMKTPEKKHQPCSKLLANSTGFPHFNPHVYLDTYVLGGFAKYLGQEALIYASCGNRFICLFFFLAMAPLAWPCFARTRVEVLDVLDCQCYVGCSPHQCFQLAGCRAEWICANGVLLMLGAQRLSCLHGLIPISPYVQPVLVFSGLPCRKTLIVINCITQLQYSSKVSNC